MNDFKINISNYNGPLEVLLDLAEGRMTVCKECDRYNSKVKFCKECNCFMPAKTLWTGMVCPLDKWEISFNLTRPQFL